MAVAALLQKFGNFAMFTSQSLPRSSFLSDTVPFVARPLSRVPPLGTTRCYATGEEGKPPKAAKAVKVKRPSTAYALFVKEKYSSISDTLPASERSVALVGKEIANIWKGLPEGEKEGYKQRASEAKAEYDQLYPKQPKQKKATGKRLSGYNMYIASRTAELQSDSSVPSGERFRRAVSDWKSLSDDEKKTFNDRAAAQTTATE